LDFPETGNTSDISIVFIAMGTTYFIQNEGFSLSFLIYYPSAVLTISLFNFPYISFVCISYPFSRFILWVLYLETIL
jgi:hypothetical protein